MDGPKFNYQQVVVQSGLIDCLTQMTSGLGIEGRLEVANRAGRFIDRARDLYKSRPNCEESRVFREMTEVTYGVVIELTG